MTVNTENVEENYEGAAEYGTDTEDAVITEYTSESGADAAGEPTQRPSASAPGAATGRRKQAVARVRIVPGTGEWTINGRTLEQYFPNKVHQQLVNEPLKVLELDGAYDVLVRVHGGGPSGQAGAVRLGVARSLNGVDAELNRPTLKKAGFLTRDARVPERKKAGLKKARKAPQYSKR
jgi:small subunit ribosomal protein S9